MYNGQTFSEKALALEPGQEPGFDFDASFRRDVFDAVRAFRSCMR
jgi:hypothetical protein